MPAFDPRLTPARADLAAKDLEGKVDGGALCRGARLRGDRAAGAVARDACARRAAPDRSAQGRARHDLRHECRRLGLGPARRRRLCRLAAGECAGARRARRQPTKSTALRTFAFPGPSIKLPPLEALPLGARLAIARVEERLAVTRSGGYVPAPHLAPLDCRRARFRRRGGALSRRAVSVGRQDRARPRLLGPRPGRADRLRRRLPARQRHAGSRARRAGPPSRASGLCSAATSSSGKATSPSCATAQRSFTPMPFTWRSRSSRSRKRSRASAMPAAKSPACGASARA